MKKLFLFSFVLLIGFGVFSQKGNITIKESQKIMKTAIHKTPTDIVVNSGQTQKLNTDATLLDQIEENIGSTFYDLQSNGLLQNRIYRYEDGPIGAVFTRGMETPPSFPDRGAGYNFYDGTSWGAASQAPLESDRAGWPSYAPLGENGEIVVSHDFGAFELFVLTREEKGTGDWTETMYTGGSGPDKLAWPRAQTSGPDRNNVHLLACTFDEYLGQTVAMVYSRSTDAGQSWDIDNVVLDGTGEDDYTEINADQYIWAEPQNGYIAFLCAGLWHDMFMMKSDDNGETWEKTVIWEHPYPFFDWNTTITDTFFCCDNSASIALDASGKAHVVFGISRVAHFEVGETYNYWPYYDGIGYWNEDMDEFSDDIHSLAPPDAGYPNSEMEVDYNYIGWTQDVDGDGVITFASDIMSYRQLGVSTMPTICIDDYGYIFVLFASTTETYEYLEYNYKHIWARAGHINGEWGDFQDLNSSIFHLVDECIYPQLASSSDTSIHYLYQLDQIPGLALDDDHEYVDNTEVYGTIAKHELIPYNPFDNQTIDVAPGFQFVSSKISPDDPDMEVVAVEIINDDLQYIRNSTGAMLRKIGPNWVNGIGDWVGTEGYLIKTNAIGEFTLSGALIDPTTPIQLFAGFQFVSYLPGEEIDASEAFASIVGDDLLYVRNSMGAMLRKIGPNWVNGIGNCIPTEGYLIKMAADAELVYPADGNPLNVFSVKKSGIHFYMEDCDGDPSSDIWTIYIGGAEVNSEGYDLEADDEIAIFDGDLLVGVLVLDQVCTEDNQFDNDLIVFTELCFEPGYTVGNTFTLKAWDYDKDLELIDFECIFSNPYGDAYEGDVFPEDEPYSLVTLSFSVSGIDESFIKVAIFPNPSNDVLNINSNSSVSNVKVLNYLGQTIDNFNVTGMEVTINTSAYNSGIYFIQIETEKGISTQKIVIE